MVLIAQLLIGWIAISIPVSLVAGYMLSRGENAVNLAREELEFSL